MKKGISIILAILLVLSLSVSAYADGTLTLTATIPEATWTLLIPADQTIDYLETSIEIGSISVTDVENLKEGQTISVNVSHTDFVCDDNSFPFTLSTSTSYNEQQYSNLGSTNRIDVAGHDSGHSDVWIYPVTITMNVDEASWLAAPAGDYTATITFSSFVF